tara:strand:+ start:4552 stop:4902 length:351 start_codon:yes stop_codon:yes gene_type:complete
MRTFFVLSVFLLLAACAQDRIAKPEPLMSEEQLINFHIDLALINAAIGYNETHYVPLDSLYKFHGIDSLTFLKNNTYYASKSKQYTRIFETVESRLKAMEERDTLGLPQRLIDNKL